MVRLPVLLALQGLYPRMVRLVINSLSQLKVFQKKIQILKKTLPTLQKQALEKVANEDVLEEIHSKMRLNNFSEKIIDATFVGKTQQMGSILRTHFISNYVDPKSGFDVSKGREEGTADHTIRAKKPDGSLRWTAKGGAPLFRKFARVKGIERLLIIEKTVIKAQNQAVTNFQNNLSSIYSKILGV